MALIITDNKKTRIIIDLEAIAENYSQVKERLPDTRIAAVIKADAYGHGAIKVAKKLMGEGCDFFAVSGIDEALEIRTADVKGTILILGYVLDEYLESAIEHDISLAVDTCEHLKKIIAASDGKPVKIHIKLDTGMNRTGFFARGGKTEEIEELAKLILENENVQCEGVFSHLAVADEDDGENFTWLQYQRFDRKIKELESLGVHPKIKHLSNSAGTYRFGNFGFDAVRVGISLYGCCDGGFKPALEFKTRIVNIHMVDADEGIGYGLTYTPDKDMRIAVIAAGYADGLKRCLSNGKGYVLCNGKRAPVVGRVCMDMSFVDVTDIPDAKVGDDVTLIGRDGYDFISADEMAEWADTIPYEILCSISKRVARIYK